MKKEDINIGDRVFHTKRREVSEGIVVDTMPSSLVMVRVRWVNKDIEQERNVSCSFLIPIKREEKEEKIEYPLEDIQANEQKTNLQWSFTSLHEKDIDWDELAQDLTKKNPIALVTISGSKCDYYVLIHDSIIKKAKCLAREKIIKEGGKVDPRVDTIIKLSNQSEFNMWVNIVKQIKHKPWPKEGRNKTKISVVLPTI